MAVAGDSRYDSAGQDRRGVVHEPGQQRRQQGHLDVLPLPGVVPVVQRRQDPHCGVKPGDHVGHGDTGLGGRLFVRPGHTHQSPDCLREQVVARQLRARSRSESGDRAVDQAGPIGAQIVPPQAEPFHHL